MALVALAIPSSAKEMAADQVRKAELFESGVRHAQIMALKKVRHRAGKLITHAYRW